MADELEVDASDLYRLMPKLIAEGQVKRVGQGWFPVEDEEADEEN